MHRTTDFEFNWLKFKLYKKKLSPNTKTHAQENRKTLIYNRFKFLKYDNEIYKLDFATENDDLIIPQIINYRENFTVKELLLI